MAKSIHKYNLNALLENLPVKKAKHAIVELDKEGIRERTFYRDRAIKVGETDDIPSERLMKYAKFFGVSIEELFNYSIKIKPITQRKPSDLMKKVMKRTGLKR